MSYSGWGEGSAGVIPFFCYSLAHVAYLFACTDLLREAAEKLVEELGEDEADVLGKERNQRGD